MCAIKRLMHRTKFPSRMGPAARRLQPLWKAASIAQAVVLVRVPDPMGALVVRGCWCNLRASFGGSSMLARIVAVAVAVLCFMAPRAGSAHTEVTPPATPVD